MNIDPARYVYVPGVTEVLDIDDIATLGLHDQNGDLITEKSLAREADEAERQQRAGLIPGGKSLAGDGSHSPVLRLVVSPVTKKKVEQIATNQGMSVSRWLRGVVEERLAEAA